MMIVIVLKYRPQMDKKEVLLRKISAAKKAYLH
jgi:hypothetical protein